MSDPKAETAQECICPYTPPETWLSAASCGYGSGYEPGSMQEWDPSCPVHPGDPYHSTPPDEPAEIRHCGGCGEDYNAFEESHVGHVYPPGQTPPAVRPPVEPTNEENTP